MYARLLGSEAPVADEYSTRACAAMWIWVMQDLPAEDHPIRKTVTDSIFCRRCKCTCSKHKPHIWQLCLQLLDGQAGRSWLAPGSHQVLRLVALCTDHENACKGCSDATLV
jgi:hypothetical protein